MGRITSRFVIEVFALGVEVTDAAEDVGCMLQK